MVPTRPGYEGTTEVGVWFRYPEGERQLAYPFITIDLLTVEPDYELFTSTFIQDPDGPVPAVVLTHLAAADWQRPWLQHP